MNSREKIDTILTMLLSELFVAHFRGDVEAEENIVEKIKHFAHELAGVAE